MNWIKPVATEIFGLFVDSGAFAVAILVWLAIVGLALPRNQALIPYAGIILFLGLLAVLLQSVLVRARQRPGS